MAVRGDSAGAGDVLDGQAGDGKIGGRVSVEVAAVVVLFDEDTVPGVVRIDAAYWGYLGGLAYLLMDSRVMPE